MFTGMAAVSKLVPLVRQPSVSLPELQIYVKILWSNAPGCRVYDAIEVFGQSDSFRQGFAALGMRCLSFDCRTLSKFGSSSCHGHALQQASAKVIWAQLKICFSCL